MPRSRVFTAEANFISTVSSDPLRLLVFCYEYPPIGGGAGNALSHLARAWVRSGHQVTVVTSHYHNLPMDEVSEGAHIMRLRVGRKHADRGRIPEMIRFMIASSKVCEAVYQTVRPDLAVAFMTLPSGATPVKLKRDHQLPFVTELRGGDVPGFLPGTLGLFHAMTRPWIRTIWEASSLVIANSGGLADLANKTAPNIPIQTLPNGVDVEVFRPGALRKSDVGLCRCIFVGRLVDDHKKISQLIQAVSRLPHVELTIVGAGPDGSKLSRMADIQGFGRIHFKGWLKGDALLQELRSSDIYVSASAWEGMSNSALEAMSCGLPLVLSGISGHRELVVEGENGFLFNAGSVGELENRLTQLAADPGMRAQLGNASRQRAVEHFDWTTLAEKHLDLYRQALKA